MKAKTAWMVLAVVASVVLGWGGEAWAYEETVNGVTWTYNYSGGGAEVVGCSKKIGAVVIPSKLNGLKVTCLGDRLFSGCDMLTSVTIPRSVTRIGDGAFSACTTLGTITIPNSVTRIGDNAFANCKKLKTVTIPNSVSSIGYGAFHYCEKLEKASLGNRVATIGAHAFCGCASLKTITIPGSVKNMGDFAFCECFNLTNAVVANGVPYIGDSAFRRCGGLRSVTIPVSVTNIDGAAFCDCLSLKTVKIPSRVQNIGGYAFAGCSLRTVTIPASVRYVGDCAFCCCSNLTEVTVFGNETKIGCGFNRGWWGGHDSGGAFADCNNVKKLYLPAEWRGTEKLAEGKVPSGVQVIFLQKKTVAFDAAGGHCTPQRLTGWVGKAYGALPTATRAGYKFGGWWTGPNGTGFRVLPTSRIQSGHRTLYAKWTGKPYTVVFSGMGGKGTMASQKVAYGTARRLQWNKFTRPGYVFVGWSRTKWGAVAYANRATVLNLAVPGGTVRLYAKWAKSTYKVAFSGMGGTGSMPPQTMKYGLASKLQWNKFKRPGYQFLGWSKTKWGTVAYANRATVKNLARNGGTVKLYARWQAIKPNLAFSTSEFAWKYRLPSAVFLTEAEGSLTATTNGVVGKTLLLNVVYANKGTGVAGAHEIKIMVKDPAGTCISQRTLSSGAMQVGGASWWHDMPIHVKTAGTHTVEVTLDSGRTVAESNEGDNVMLLKFHVVAQRAAKSTGARAAGSRGAAVAATTSDGSDGSAAADGDEGTAWVVDAEEGAWVVLSLPEVRTVESVEVVGENLPAGMRVLLSEDAEEWFEGEGGAARYVWVAFPAGSGVVTVMEIQVE